MEAKIKKISSKVTKSGSGNSKKSWFRDRIAIITMTSLLGVGVVGVGISMPLNVLLQSSNSTIIVPDEIPPEIIPPSEIPEIPPAMVPPPPEWTETHQKAFEKAASEFNAKSFDEKANLYNSAITTQFQKDVLNFWFRNYSSINRYPALLETSPLYKFLFANLVPETSPSGFLKETVELFYRNYGLNTFRLYETDFMKIPSRSTILGSVQLEQNVQYYIYNYYRLSKNVNIRFDQITKNPYIEVIPVTATAGVEPPKDLKDNWAVWSVNRIPPQNKFGISYSANLLYKDRYVINDEFTENLMTPLLRKLLGFEII